MHALAGVAVQRIAMPSWAAGGVKFQASATPVGDALQCSVSTSTAVTAKPAALRHVAGHADNAVSVAGNVLASLTSMWSDATRPPPSVVRIHASVYIPPGASVSVPAGIVLMFARGAGMVVEGSLEVLGTRAAPVVLTSSSRWAGVTGAGRAARVRLTHAVVSGARTNAGPLITLRTRVIAALGSSCQRRGPLGWLARGVCAHT